MLKACKQNRDSLKCYLTFQKGNYFCYSFQNRLNVEKTHEHLQAFLPGILSTKMKIVSALKSYLWYFQRWQKILFCIQPVFASHMLQRIKHQSHLLKAALCCNLSIGLSIFDRNYEQVDIRIHSYKQMGFLLHFPHHFQKKNIYVCLYYIIEIVKKLSVKEYVEIIFIHLFFSLSLLNES